MNTVAKKATVLFGSCRNLKFKETGELRNLREADTTLAFVNESIASSKLQPDLVMLIGDQIYSDNGGANFLGGPVDPFAEGYRNRYRRAFGTEHLSRLVANHPTFMILDDHEIVNDWHEQMLDPEFPGTPPLGSEALATRREMRRAALESYTLYQQCHGPAGWNSAK